MALEQDLADALIREHPERAALALEALEAGAVVPLLARGEAAERARLLQRLSPSRAARVIALLPRARAAVLLAHPALDDAVRIVRRLEPEAREELLPLLAARRARAIRALLAFPEGTAGALMDPDVLALPRDLSAEDALARVRSEPESARYDLYVVDPEQRLVGALNLRELMLASPAQRLGELMVPEPFSLPSSADRSAVVTHPGWKEVHALPVVDEQGRYLGAVRYRRLRELEQELLGKREEDPRTSAALGQLFAAGAAGLFEALGGTGGEASRGR